MPVGGVQRAVVKITLDAPPPPEKSIRPAVNLAIVLDRSGSMAGQKLERAKDAAIEALRHLGPMDMFSVVVYDHNVSTVVSAQRLAQNSDGNTYFVESSRDLPRIFTAELGDVLSVVAKKVHVIIECPGGVKPLNIIGREGRIKGRIVELSLNQLYGSQEKYALIEVEIPGGKNGEKKDVAYVNVSYENPFTQKKETSSGRAYASFSKDRIKVKKSVNVAVQREYNFNLNALSQEKAISLSDKGKNKEAVSELKKSAHKLREVGREYNDEELLKRAEEMEVQADQVEKEGMTKKYRKVLRTDSYQMKNQQMSK